MNNKRSKNGNHGRVAVMLAGTGLLAGLMFSGCSMCCGPYDYHYPTYGGSVQRADPVWGRVGSIYSDPGPFGGPPADHNLSIDGSKDSKRNLEDIDGEDPSLEPPGTQDENGKPNPGDTDILPPPNLDRPGPEEETRLLQRIRNQSRINGRQRWR